MTDLSHTSLETKAAPTGTSGDIADAFEDFMRAFEGFKDANDERLNQLEHRAAADVVTIDKLERIDRALNEHKRVVDELTLKAKRPQLAGKSAVLSAPALEHKQAWDQYMRSGDVAGLRALEQKALSVGSDPDGGYLVPDETETEIMRALSNVSPIRAIAGVREVSASVYKKPFAIAGASTGWVGETDERAETDTPTLAELTFPTMELYAMPAATGALLDDAVVNIDQWIADEVQIAFAEQEGAAFVDGDGANKPKGFLDYTKIDDASWSWGNVGYLATGVDGGFAASDPSDQLIDLVYALKSGYRANAHWVMSRKTQSEIRKLKDADGNYIWQPAAVAGQSASLMNFPIAESEDMPAIGSDSFAIAFGDFNRGYLIVDRAGVRVLRDPYSNKPFVLFYTTKRVGGGIQNFEAIKLLKFGTS